MLWAHHVLDRRQDLTEHQSALQVRQASFSADAGEQLPPAGVLHHQVEPLEGLHHLVQADHVGVGQPHHAADFRGAEGVQGFAQPLLIQDLHRHAFCHTQKLWVS